MFRTTIAWGCGLLALAVGLGAFGAHGLKNVIGSDAIAQWHTGVEYHFIHSLGLLILASLSDRLPEGPLRWVRGLFLFGVAAFCGSLYLLSTRDLTGFNAMVKVLGPITPIGGLAFMAGWVLLLITALRRE
jgi:uncharacterized membrane protein YgdD (TMEM256/DUF423 family)